MSTAPRPQTSATPSAFVTSSPPNGSRCQPSECTGTTSVWPIRQRLGALGSGPVDAGHERRPTRRRLPPLDGRRPGPRRRTAARRRCGSRDPESGVPSLTHWLRINVCSSSTVAPVRSLPVPWAAIAVVFPIRGRDRAPCPRHRGRAGRRRRHRLRSGPGRHRGVLRRLRLRPRRLGQRHRRHRQAVGRRRRPDLRGLRRAGLDPPRRQSGRAQAPRDEEGVVRAGRRHGRADRDGHRRRDPVRAAGRAARCGSTPG